MTERTFDAKEIREVGEEVCPKLADEYDALVDTADKVGDVRHAFEDSGGTLSDLGEFWVQCFTLYYNAIYETGVNIRAYGTALVDIADQGEDDEAMIEKSFAGAADDGLAEGYDTVAEQAEEQGFDPGADDYYDLEQAPNPYEEDLSASDPNKPV